MNLEPRRRVSKPKCKTGCKTCKKRRVKCDEGKPECARCVRFWGKCDGYDDLNDSKGKKDRAYLPILPATQRSQSLEILEDVSITVFQNEQEHSYFQTFLDDIAPRTMISPRFSVGSLLTLVLPRACWTEPALRHGFVALGALSMTQPIFQLSSLKRGNSQKHYRYALEQYQKAIRTILLIFCFEMGNDRRDLAIWQMENGIQIFRRWLANYPSYGVLPMASPAPGIIEDDIMLIFRSMSHRPGNVTVELDLSSQSGSKNDKPNGLDPTYIVRGMPAIFSSVEEARYFLEIIATNTIHFFQSQKCADPIKDNVRRRPDSYYNFFDEVAKDLTEDQLLEHESCMSAFKHWLQASKRLLVESQAVGGSFYNRMACLHAAAMSTMIMQARVRFKDQYGYDRFLPLFREIITIQGKVLDSLDHKGLQYANGEPLDDGINLNIFFVAVKCRHRSLRREVISQLRRTNRREGFWDSAICALVAEFLMRTEEGDSEEEVLPEKSRVSLSGIAVDSQKRRVFVEWIPYSSTGEKVYRDTWLSW